MEAVYWASINFQNLYDDDIFELQVSSIAQKPVEIVGFFIGQSTRLGDHEEAFVRLAIIRGFTTGGSGGAFVAGKRLHPDSAAVGTVIKRNNDTLASGGTPVTLWSHTWNVRYPLFHWFRPGLQIRHDDSTTAPYVVLRALNQVLPAMLFSATIFWREGQR
jgi:hypothetical protein